MMHFVAVCSKKGGVGKTTISLNLGLGLQKLGTRVLVVDAHFVNPQISTYLGSSEHGTPAAELVTGMKPVADAVFQHSSGLHILPLKGELPLGTEWKILLDTLQSAYDIVVLDTNSGTESERIIEHADSALLVTTPDNVAVLQAKHSARIAEKYNIPLLGVIVNKCADERSLEEVSAFLNAPILTTLPYEALMNNAIDMHYPIIAAYPESEISKNLTELAQYLLGKTTAKYKLEWTSQK